MLTHYTDILFFIHGVLVVLLLFSALLGGILWFYLYVWKNRKTNSDFGGYWLNRFERNQEKIIQILEELKNAQHNEKS